MNITQKEVKLGKVHLTESYSYVNFRGDVLETRNCHIWSPNQPLFEVRVLF